MVKRETHLQIVDDLSVVADVAFDGSHVWNHMCLDLFRTISVLW